jgi:hypothetical protein
MRIVVGSRVLWCTLVCAGLIAAPRPARADDAADAEALIAQGVALREQAHDREALLLFRRAAALHASPRANAQVALAQQALGEWVDAEAGLVAALAVLNDAWIERNRAALEQALGTVRGQLGWITVDTDAPGVQIRIDGRLVPTLPMAEPLRIAAGVVVVEALAPGYEAAVRYVQVRAGDHAHESMRLVALAVPPTLSVGAATAPSSPESRFVASRGQPWAWVSLGAAAVLVGGGIAAHVVREENAAKYDNHSCVMVSGQTRDQVCGGYGATSRTATVLAVIGYSAGGAAGILSAYLFVSGSGPRRSTTTGVAARCGIGADGLAWSAACTVPF